MSPGLPPLHHMILLWANLLLPAAVLDPASIIWTTTSCVHCSVCFTTSGSSHTLGSVLSRELRRRRQCFQGSDKVVCLISVAQDGPTLLYPPSLGGEKRRGEKRRGEAAWGVLGTLLLHCHWRAPICFVLSQHSSLQVSQTGA